jgi:hypothetical protein
MLEMMEALAEKCGATCPKRSLLENFNPIWSLQFLKRDYFLFGEVTHLCKRRGRHSNIFIRIPIDEPFPRKRINGATTRAMDPYRIVHCANAAANQSGRDNQRVYSLDRLLKYAMNSENILLSRRINVQPCFDGQFTRTK